MTTAILVTTKDRPQALARSLPQIAKLGAPILVVDDGSVTGKWTEELQRCAIADYLYIPHNRGLAAALNVGISYWLADKSIEWISYFQDDVDVHPKTLETLSRFQANYKVMTGHDAAEHEAYATRQSGRIYCKQKWSIRATHVHGHVDWWLSVMPFPTRELGAPKRNGGGKGLGSNVDWWFCRDAPNSCKNTNQPILCVPNLVRTFSLSAEDSTWNNAQKPEPELRRDL